MKGDSPLTVQQLLRLPSFGRKSLSDLLIALEKFLRERIRTGTTDSRQTNRRTGELPNISVEPGIPTAEASETSPTPTPTPWEDTGKLLSPLLAAVAELHGAETLADVLNPECMRLASRMGIAAKIGAIRIDDVGNGTPGLASVVSSHLRLAIEAASENERTIIEHRLLRTPPKTLEEVGSLLGVTRERIRQIQARVEGKSEPRWDGSWESSRGR